MIKGKLRLFLNKLVHCLARHAGFEPEYVTCDIDASPSQFTVLLSNLTTPASEAMHSFLKLRVTMPYCWIL